MSAVEVEVGQLWVSVGRNQYVQGLFRVVAANASVEAGPDSWEMRRVTDNKRAYMHRKARASGAWSLVSAQRSDEGDEKR